MNEYIEIANMFAICGEVLEIVPYGEGHINVTMLVTTTEKRYLLQKMNTRVFPNSDGLMNNICRVTRYLSEKGVETITVIPTKNGEDYLKGEDCYRVYAFNEGTVTFQTVDDARVFKNVGRAFGEFQNHLAEFDASVLTEPIKDFHNTPKRFADFKTALEKDAFGRASSCKEEIEFILSRENTFGVVTDALANGDLPTRVTHNDTKLNNILMDSETGEARAVIDLDTIMPGSMLYDFGDSIRFGASTAKEDETDLSKVHFDISLFKAYAEGYYGAVKESITEREKELLPYSAYLLTMECGMRFLTDYLSGDTYFATKYDKHNLVRCRTQLRLASEIETQLDEMKKIIYSI